MSTRDSIAADAKAERAYQHKLRTRDRADIENDILADLLDGKRWTDLADYIYIFYPDWLNETMLNGKKYRHTVLQILHAEKPSWLADLVEIIAEEREAGGA